MQTKSSDSFLVTVVNGVPRFHDVTDSALASGVYQLPVPATPPMPVTSPLRLEAGKSYLNRLGEVIGPIKRKTSISSWPFYLNEDDKNDPSWNKNGRIASGEKNEEDLITEHIAPQSEEDGTDTGNPATPDFPAVGTRLRFTMDKFRHADECQGAEVCVTTVDSDGIWTNKSGERKGHWFFQNWREGLEIVPPLPTPPVRPEGKIFTRQINPSIPIRSYDWEATRDRYEPLDLIGYGETEAEAIADLKQREESQVVAPTDEQRAKEIIAQGGIPEGSMKTASTYPPDESEWPEKLPAPEGCVWERQPMDGRYDEDGVYILLSNHVKNPVWEEIDTRDDAGWQGFVVFKAVPSLFKGDPSEWDAANESEAVPAPQWRELGETERPVTEEDEVSFNGTDFMEVGDAGPERTVADWKLISTAKIFRTRRPLPPSAVVDPVSGVTVPIFYTRPGGFASGIDAVKWDGTAMWSITNGEESTHDGVSFDQAEAFVLEGRWVKSFESPPAERKAREWGVMVKGSRIRDIGGVSDQGVEFLEKNGWSKATVREVIDGIGGAE